MAAAAAIPLRELLILAAVEVEILAFMAQQDPAQTAALASSSSKCHRLFMLCFHPVLQSLRLRLVASTFIQLQQLAQLAKL
jgi:hypothetical protein